MIGARDRQPLHARQGRSRQTRRINLHCSLLVQRRQQEREAPMPGALLTVPGSGTIQRHRPRPRLEPKGDDEMIQPADLVECKLYADEQDVWRDAVRALTWLRPECRREVAVLRYSNGEVSLGKAAHLAGLCLEEMKDLLRQRGIKLRLGPRTLAELEREVDVLREGIRGVSG
ncbi:MAG: hypothetical protein COY42_16630 [Armatimonadetes bacterium CG_4_10_14_0_8_um_filter_66_14]|nr:MAG: hypothetical protein COS65_15515 [Armatimonadetes bacterium CG06_land_8_20_14_3_00_66_21]PIX39114.1 MAG: hypothetical protein COZ57_28845 [Armatimonadetes bacterium CG_4_8_14_3_um_filter_66_20]PIZ42975.1 MAG: hypothetical protein COY42_16630 [Armatimonadetes bacterium CG_4_10_14_0_8_um_filter_66_14]PJB65282.1 MAG: hypothetical protein CO096_18835 [Armatimonadetes bacterium CG_4_9_14_3_um_filter_66_14]